MNSPRDSLPATQTQAPRVLPFPLLGRCTYPDLTLSQLTLRVLLQQPAAALSSSLTEALPGLLRDRVVVEGPIVVAGTARGLPALLKSAYQKGKTKPSPVQQLADDAEGWLLKLHEAHPIALATWSWHPWLGHFHRPEASAAHLKTLSSPPWSALRTLAGLVDAGDPSREARALTSSTLLYLSDSGAPSASSAEPGGAPALFQRVKHDVDVQRLFAHSSADALQLLGVLVDDDALAAVAAGSRLPVRARGFSLADLHRVQAIATPLNTVWGVVSRLRLFALSEPLHPSLIFDDAKDDFFVRDETWGLDDGTGGVADCAVATGAAFASRVNWLVDQHTAPSSEGDRRFLEVAARGLRRQWRGSVVDGVLVWA